MQRTLRERQQPCRGRLERGDDDLALADPEPVGRGRRHLGRRGPTRTRARLPMATTDPTGARMWLTAVSSGAERASATSHGWIAIATRPRPSSVVHTVPPVSSVTAVRPSPSPRRDAFEDVRPRERRHERVGRSGEQLGGRADLQQPAVDDHADPVREGRRVLDVVGDEHRRQPEPREEGAELTAHRVARVRVERRERLVEQHHVRVPCERTRERRPAGALRPRASRGRASARSAMRNRSSSSSTARRSRRAEGDVATHAQVREERVLLEDEADRPAFRRDVHPARRVEPGLAPEGDAAPRRPQEPGDRPEDGRLPRPGRADQRERLRVRRRASARARTSGGGGKDRRRAIAMTGRA